VEITPCQYELCPTQASSEKESFGNFGFNPGLNSFQSQGKEDIKSVY